MKRVVFILVLVSFFGTGFGQSGKLQIDTGWYCQESYYRVPIFSKTRMDSLDAIRDSLNSLLENLQIQEDSLELSKDSLWHVYTHSSGRKSRKAWVQYYAVQERYYSLHKYKWTVKKILDQHNGGSSHQSDKVPEGWYVCYRWSDTTFPYKTIRSVIVSLDDTSKSFVSDGYIGVHSKRAFIKICEFLKENGPFTFQDKDSKIKYYSFLDFENGYFIFKDINSEQVKKFSLKDVWGREKDLRYFLPKKKYVTFCKKYGKSWANHVFEKYISIGLPVEILRIIRPDLGYVSYSTDLDILQTSSGSLTVGIMDGKVQSVTYLGY